MSSSEHQFSDEELRLLVECLDGGSKAAVRKAVDKLVAAAAGDRRVAEILRKALVHERERVRWGAAYALGQIPNALDLSALSALFAAIASLLALLFAARPTISIRSGMSFATLRVLSPIEPVAPSNTTRLRFIEYRQDLQD